VRERGLYLRGTSTLALYLSVTLYTMSVADRMCCSLNCSVARNTGIGSLSLLQLQQQLADMRGGIEWQSDSGRGWLPTNFAKFLPSCGHAHSRLHLNLLHITNLRQVCNRAAGGASSMAAMLRVETTAEIGGAQSLLSHRA
jgi:hypothetical protein